MSGSERARRATELKTAQEARRRADERFSKALGNVNKALAELDNAREALAQADLDAARAFTRAHWDADDDPEPGNPETIICGD